MKIAKQVEPQTPEGDMRLLRFGTAEGQVTTDKSGSPLTQDVLSAIVKRAHLK